MIDLQLDPPAHRLRSFAVVWWPLAVIAMGAWLLHQGLPMGHVAIIAGVGAAVSLLGAWRPALIRPLWIVLMLVAFPIGVAVSIVLAASVFYLVITPIGLCLRLVGHDPLQLRRGRATSETYWVARVPVTDPTRYYRQF